MGINRRAENNAREIESNYSVAGKVLRWLTITHDSADCCLTDMLETQKLGVLLDFEIST